MKYCLPFPVIGIILFTALPAAAGAAAKKTPEPAWVVPSHIQLMPMMVPVRARSQRSAPLTVYLEVREKTYVGLICNQVPRLRDAMLQVLSRRPIPVQKRRMVLGDLPARLLGPMNSALGRPMIRTLYLVPGVVRMGGGSLAKLPFARINGCKTIKEKEAERLKREQAAKQQ